MTKFTEFKTEIIGVSAEIAIADIFGVEVSPSYRNRGSEKVVSMIKPIAEKAFRENNIPRPTRHIAEDQNPIDFILEGGLTLSVKTNQKSLGKAAPQIVGQPTTSTYFKTFYPVLGIAEPSTEEESKLVFKEQSISNIDKVMDVYWENLFNTDYYLHFFDVLDSEGVLRSTCDFLFLNEFQRPIWDKEKFTFTQTLESWNESNTVKYYGVSIGEFQVHNNRNSLKYRFIMKNVMSLIDEGII